MRNRAKCKLCKQIIESFHASDYVVCKCDEISLFGGQALYCGAKNWDNFIRINDDGIEMPIQVFEKEEAPKVSAEEMISEMIANLENLPANAMNQPLTHYDMLSLLYILRSLVTKKA